VCLLALRWRVVPGVPVALAANRDEAFDRPFDGPALREGPVPFVAPLDRRAGGTWVGLNAAGLVVGVTNRPQREVVDGRRSRGTLAAESLAAPSAARLRAALEKHLRTAAPYNNFHLLAADADDAFVLRYHDGWQEFTDLDEGDHFLTNEDELDEPSLPGVAAAAPAGAAGAVGATGAAAEARRLASLLGLHDPVLPSGRAPCRHGPARGTVCAAVIAVPDGGVAGAAFLFAAGPPCTTPAEDVSTAARALARAGSPR
jgi:uncharacterized protein with NRDE domain